MRHLAGALIAGLCLIGGCTTSEVLVAHSVPLSKNKEEIPEAQLLDVGVAVFDSGVPEGEVDHDVLEQLIKQGTFVQIRRTEALYMAVLLRDTMQKSGNWGTVWVTPKDSTAADLSVDGKVLHSDGDTVVLHMRAVDATGHVWVEKDYHMSTAAGAFNRQRYPDLDPYQDVFNEMANDLAAARRSLSANETQKIRTVASMRYAADLSPEAFGNYVTEERGGRYDLSRLPAEGDPQFERTQRVRQRERLFLDTLDQHYAKFYKDASEPYNGWREYSREEAIEVQELTKSARFRTGMGVATIVASIVYGANSNSNSFGDRMLRDALAYMGTEMLRTASVRRQEKKLHSDSLEELSGSFNDEIKPVIVQVQGTEHRLVGTADAQYQEWRDLLRQLFESESGLAADDVTVYAEPEPAAPIEDALPTLPTPAIVDQAAPEGTSPADAAPAAAGATDAAPAEASTPSTQDAAPAAEEAPAGTVTDAAASPKPGA